MKFRVPKDDDLDSDGSDAEEPFEDHEYDETDATSELNISYNGAITKSSASIESMLLPSLQNLQLIYKSPKAENDKLSEILYKSASSSPSGKREQQRAEREKRRLLNLAQNRDPLVDLDLERRTIARERGEKAKQRVEMELKARQQTTSIDAALEQQQLKIQQMADQIAQEEKEKQDKLKTELERNLKNRMDKVQKALRIVREREEAVEAERQMRLRQEQEANRAEQERERLEREREQEKRRLQEEESKQREAELAKEQQAADRLAKQQQQQESQINRNYGNEKSIEYAQELMAKVKDIKTNIDSQVKLNAQMYREALRYRMAFTTKVGALTNSKSHILQFFNELNEILENGRKTSQQLYTWLLNNLAKQFVKQSEAEVAVNLKKAFPLAFLWTALAVKHSDLIIFTRGRLFKKCPCLIPQYPKRIEGESDDDLRRRMGYRMIDGGKLETELHFQERMFGMIAFYAAIIQTDLSIISLQNPHGLEYGWSYLSQLLNMTPRKITPGAIETFLRIAGCRFLVRYGRQAHKLVRYIQHVYMPLIKQPGSEGPKVRLQLFLDEYQSKGQLIPPFEGSELRS